MTRRWSRARQAILDAGGAHECNSFTRFYLALLGQIGYDECPCVPPELVLIPSRWGFSLSAMSAWTRTIVVPLSIMSYFKPVRSLARRARHRRAVPRATAASRRGARPAGCRGPISSWGSTACSSGSIAGSPPHGGSPAIRAAHRWMLEHCENTDGLGAIFPPMVYSIIALRCLDYDLDSPDRAVGDQSARRPADRRGRPGSRAALPLAGLGHGDRLDCTGRRPGARRASRLGRAVDWLLAKEVRNPGDWQTRRPRASSRPAGTSSSTTRFIPISTTARWWCLLCNRSPLADDPAVEAATRRGVNWLLSMQNRDGGWAAYDVDIDNQVLTQLPFADHNAMLDPSCADITARVLELLGTLGYRADHPVGRPRARLPLEHPGARGLLVRPLGRQLHLRDLAGLAGPEGPRFPHGSPGRPEGGGMARIDPAALGSLGRDLPELRRPDPEGDRRADALADGLGHARLDRRRPCVLRPPSAAASIT